MELTRRHFLNIVGMIGSSALLQNAHAGSLINNLFHKSNLKYLYMDSGRIGYKNSVSGNNHKVGDIITFYPSLEIDVCWETHANATYFKHVIYDIYEFIFTPATKFYNDKWGYHEHIIELDPCFFAILGNPSKQFESLNIDRFYKGYGRLSNYDTNVNTTIKTEMKHLKRVAKIEKFIINEINIEWCNKLKKENLDQFDYDIWETLEYWDNFDNFKKNIIPYQNYKELQTSHTYGYGFHPIYYVNCLI